MIRALAFASAVAAIAVAPSFALAQYSKNASRAAQEGIFIYRPTTPSGNIQIQPRAGLSAASQRGVFIYPLNSNGNFTVPPRSGVSPFLRPNRLFNQPLFLADGTQQSNAFIDRVSPNAIVVNAEGELFTVKPDADANIEVVGMATRDFLKPGQLVKFTGKFDADGKSITPLDQLAVVSLRPGDKAGATPFSDDDNSSAAKKSADPAENSPTSLAVLGRINSILGNTLTVGTGTDVYKVDIDSNVKVDLNTSDFSIAQPGDKIAVSGYISKPGVAQAKEIKITLAKPARSKRPNSTP